MIIASKSISKIRFLTGKLVSSINFLKSRIQSLFFNSTQERFKLIFKSGYLVSQSLKKIKVFSKTHFPTLIIILVSSNNGINSKGEIAPYFSHLHLKRASNPINFSSFTENCG